MCYSRYACSQISYLNAKKKKNNNNNNKNQKQIPNMLKSLQLSKWLEIILKHNAGKCFPLLSSEKMYHILVENELESVLTL